MIGEQDTILCSRYSKRWKCSRPAKPGYKNCAICLQVHRRSKAKTRSSKVRCWWCGRKVANIVYCTRCRALKAEAKHPKLVHDTLEHMRYIRAKDNPRSRCAASGYSLIALRKIGEKLTVDRIDSTKGYVRGNMQLLAASLNSAKGRLDRVPMSAMRSIERKMRRCAHDKLSGTRHYLM